MARILPGPMVSNISGSIGGQTFATGPGGLMVRTRSSPTQPNTAAQLAQRQMMSQLSKAWATSLFDPQRHAWIDFAANNPIPGAFGEPMVLTGIAMYNRLNRSLLAAGFARIDDPPPDLLVPSLTTLTLTLTHSDPGPPPVAFALSLAFAPTPIGTNIAMVVFATPALSQGIANVQKQLRQVTVTALNDSTPTDIAGDWTDVFGLEPPVGTRVNVEAFLIDSTTGATSPVLRAFDDA